MWFRSHARPPSHRGLGAALLPNSLSRKTTSPELRALKLSFSLQGISVVPQKTFCNFLPNKVEGVAGGFKLGCQIEPIN